MPLQAGPARMVAKAAPKIQGEAGPAVAAIGRNRPGYINRDQANKQARNDIHQLAKQLAGGQL